MAAESVDELDISTSAVPVEDLDRDSVWVSHVRSTSPHFGVAYSNDPLVVRLFEEAGIEVRQSPMFDRDQYEGTRLRLLMEGDGVSTARPRRRR